MQHIEDATSRYGWNQNQRLEQRNMKISEIWPLIESGLRNCQIDAIHNLEKSFCYMRPRALIQMATGSGKTYTAVTLIYRLIKFAIL